MHNLIFNGRSRQPPSSQQKIRLWVHSQTSSS